MSEFFKTPKTKALLWTLCGILALLVAYGLGIIVGYRRAIFTSNFDEHYYQIFNGDPSGRPMIGMMTIGPMTPHGVAGQVIDIASGTFSVRDMNGNEESIVISSGTPVRELSNEISPDEIEVGDTIAVIGEPNTAGQISARFIRVFEASGGGFGR